MNKNKKSINFREYKLDNLQNWGIISLTIFLASITLFIPYLFSGQLKSITQGIPFIFVSLPLYFFTSRFFYNTFKKIINSQIKIEDNHLRDVEILTTISLSVASIFLGICSIILTVLLIVKIELVGDTGGILMRNTIVIPILAFVSSLILLFKLKSLKGVISGNFAPLKMFLFCISYFLYVLLFPLIAVTGYFIIGILMTGIKFS